MVEGRIHGSCRSSSLHVPLQASSATLVPEKVVRGLDVFAVKQNVRELAGTLLSVRKRVDRKIAYFGLRLRKEPG